MLWIWVLYDGQHSSIWSSVKEVQKLLTTFRHIYGFAAERNWKAGLSGVEDLCPFLWSERKRCGVQCKGCLGEMQGWSVVQGCRKRECEVAGKCEQHGDTNMC